MPFDLATAKPVLGTTAPKKGTFDLATAKPVVPPQEDTQGARSMLDKAYDATIDSLKAAGSLATTAVAAPLSGYAGLAATAANIIPNLLGKGDIVDPANVVDKVQEYGTYSPQYSETTTVHPTSAVGKALVDPQAALDKAADTSGGYVTDKTGSPALGAVTKTAIDAVPYVLDPMLRGAARVMKGPSALEAAAPPAPKPPEHTVAGSEHTVTSANGKTVARRRGDTIQITDSETTGAAQGNGEGTARVKKLADVAKEKNLTLASDSKVSPAAAKVYDRLETDGYKVTRNSYTADADGNLISDSGRPVFEIKPTLAEKDMTPERLHAEAVNVLDSNNVRLAKSQRGIGFGNKQAASAGRAADTIVGTSDFATKQRQDFTSAVLKKAGLAAKNATTDAMSELKGIVGEKYADLHERVPTVVDKPLIDKLTEMRDTVTGEVDASRAAPLLKKIDDIISKAQAGNPGEPVTISGKASQDTRSSLVRMEQSQDPSTKHFANELKEALDDAFERGAAPEDVQKMRDVRSQFVKMKQIEESIGTDKTISPQKLMQVLKRKRNASQRIYGRGDQDLIELAEAGAKVIPEHVANSGTVTRGADIGKVAAVLTHPVAALKVGGTIVAGRLYNEAGALKNTAAGKQAAAIRKTPVETPDTNTARAVRAGVVAETQDERKRRLRAEALRK